MSDELAFKQYRVVHTAGSYIRGFGGKVIYTRITEGRVVVRICKDTGGPPPAPVGDGVQRRDNSMVTLEEVEYLRLSGFLTKAIDAGEAMEATETAETDDFSLIKLGDKMALRLIGRHVGGGQIQANYKLASFTSVMNGSLVPTWGEGSGCDFTLNEMRSFAQAMPRLECNLAERKGSLFVSVNGDSLLDRVIDLWADAVFDKHETELVRLDPKSERTFGASVSPLVATITPNDLISRLFAADRCRAHDASIGGLQEAISFMGTTEGHRKVTAVLKPQVIARRDAMQFVSGQLKNLGYDMAGSRSTPPPPTPTRCRTLRNDASASADGSDDTAMQPPRAPKRRAVVRRLILESSDEDDNVPIDTDKS